MDKTTSTKRQTAQKKVSNAFSDITRATRFTLQNYVQFEYYKSFAKVIAYLGIDSVEAQEILNSMNDKIKTLILRDAQESTKNDASVISEVEHIITSSGMVLDDDYQVIKDNLAFYEKDFAEKALNEFQNSTPIFKSKIDECIFNFEDIIYLDDRSIQKLLNTIDTQDLVFALKDTSQEIKNRFFDNLSPELLRMAKEDISFMGPVKLSRVEAAQTKIVQTVRALEGNGKIIVSRKEDDKLID